MKNILFFTENGWAFGAIHRALCKKLYKYGINADVLDWHKEYSNEEFAYMNRTHDYFATTPESVNSLLNKNIPENKIVVVVHGSECLHRCLSYTALSVFSNIHKYAVVHPFLKDLSLSLNIPRVPDLLRVGIDTDYFKFNPSENLGRLGYAGAKAHTLHGGKDCKRAFLADLVAITTGLPITYPHKKMTHMSMPGYYLDFDCLLVTSSEETAGLPAMEAASTGKLVISSNVGYFNSSVGVVCSNNEFDFVADAVKAIEIYKDPEKYKIKCIEAREYAVANYDWENHIEAWANLFI
jgi:glycosyltransferase involved in cell wall biosynthesis